MLLDRRSRRFGGTVRQFLIHALLRVRDKDGALLPLRANRVQAEFDRRHQRRSIVLKARQMGVTTWIAARFFINTISRPGTVSVQVAHDQESAEEIFRIVHRFLANLPERLRQGALQTSRANVRQLVFPLLDSEYRVDSAADPNAGRGLTIHNLHCSEVARWPGDAAATLAALRAAVPRSGEIVLESTPNGAGGCFYDEWQRAPERGYARHFFPWWWAKDYVSDDGAHAPSRASVADGAHAPSRASVAAVSDGAQAPSRASVAQPPPAVLDDERLSPVAAGRRPSAVSSPAVSSRASATESTDEGARVEGPCVSGSLTAAERALVREHGLTAAQIAFRRELRATYGTLCAQEYAEDPESCFLASGECVFDIEVVQKRLSDMGSAAEVVESRDHGRLLIFWPPRPGADYIIGADPAGGGTDGDFSCAQVIERVTGLHCAELHGHFPPQEFAARLAALAREYNGALVAVERNNHGHAVLAYLVNAERYGRLYTQRGQMGWLTNVATRPAMLERFAALLRLAPQLFGSARLLRECRSFVRTLDGTPAAAPGAHDDTILAMAIALAVREEMAGNGESTVHFASMAR